jgi:hypothetical protein
VIQFISQQFNISFQEKINPKIYKNASYCLLIIFQKTAQQTEKWKKKPNKWIGVNKSEVLENLKYCR